MPCKKLLIPVRKCRRLSGSFTFGRSAVLQSEHDADRLPMKQLRTDLAGLGVRARLTRSAKSADVRLIRDKQIPGDEAYRLTIRPDGIEIISAGDAGAYYAVQTLCELLTIHKKAVPAMRIDDKPDFARRGVYHDCSRGKVPKVGTLKQLIERLAHWKINELQLYIENVFAFASYPTIGRGYSPFGPADILAVQEHCKTHHIRLVGSLSSFGHMEKILALPEYSSLGELPGHMHHPGGTTLCPSDPGSIKLLRDMYAEFVPLFEADDFNVCCDEPWELGKGRTKGRAEKIGVGRVYLDFILKIHKLCRKHGKRMNMWADIVLTHPEIIPDIPKDIVMLNWDYAPWGPWIGRTGEIAKAGLPAVCCPGTHGWQSHGTRLDQSVANVARFARLGRRHGAEGLLNTDWGDFGHRNTLGVSLHGFAHGAACAWCEAKTDHSRFTERFCLHAFGDQTGKLAPALRKIGAEPGGLLYHTLIEPFDPGKNTLLPGCRVMEEPERDKSRYLVWRRNAAKRLHLPKLTGADEFKALAHQRLEATKNLRIPTIATGNEFEALAMEEFGLALRMDKLACRRLLIQRDFRAGKTIPARTLRCLADDMRAMVEDFTRLWRARNRPSRLRDNLVAFKRTITEAEKLSGR